MVNEVLRVSQSSVAQALARDYFCIYYVNLDNDHFIEYSASPEYRRLGLPQASDDYTLFNRENFERVIDPEDRERFLSGFTKAKVLKALDSGRTFTMTFRMLFDGSPVYVHLKVDRMVEDEGRHAVVGISSMDAQMRAREAYERATSDSVTYARVAQALAADYFSIYVVDPDTDRFYEYSSVEEYGQLGVEKEGGDFFNVSRRNMARILCPEDRERFMDIFTREKIMAITERDGHFTTRYRLMLNGEPVWVSMKATLLSGPDGRHLIIGTNNINAQVLREEEYRRRVAEAGTSARNDFLSNMSHDIRTPMNAIVGYTNIALDRADDHEAVRGALEKISSASHFLLSLINDILDISKIESGQMQLSPAPCDLRTLLDRIEDITALQAKNKALKITYSRDGLRHLQVEADELRIEQALINIISNAIKYTPEGGTVDLYCREEPDEAPGTGLYTFIVRDTGIGISKEYLPRLFESFTREERTTVNRVQGTGLGLAITARVVEMMGGTISVRSEPGEGSEFTVKLRLRTLGTDGKQAKRAPQTPLSLEGRTVLVVEDNDVNAEIAQMVLGRYGAGTERAVNGQEAVDMVRANGDRYDAVLMDIQMPVMNGLDAARAIRALEGERYARLPIVAMSANAYDEDVRACLAAGMNGHIAKPFRPEELAERLIALMEARL